MKKENKKLLKNFKAVVADLLDNFDQYTDEEKAQVQEIFQKAVDLNTILDKYDISKKTFWSDFFEAYSNYFDVVMY